LPIGRPKYLLEDKEVFFAEKKTLDNPVAQLDSGMRPLSPCINIIVKITVVSPHGCPGRRGS
jgi:hypothetical protein